LKNEARKDTKICKIDLKLDPVVNDGKWVRVLNFKNEKPSNNIYGGKIPPILKRLHSNLTFEKYKCIKSSPMFLKNSAFVCETCFLKITRFTKEAGNDLETIV
jgi:hypothetical protein